MDDNCVPFDAILREQDESEPDTNLPPPTATPEMFPGLIGDFARAAADGTEVNPVAAAAAALSFIGAMAGRDLYHPIGDTYHHAREFWLHVGRSSRGKKGDSMSLLRRVENALGEYVADDEPPLTGQVHRGGLSTREGLALMIHDGFKQGKETFQPITNKRL